MKHFIYITSQSKYDYAARLIIGKKNNRNLHLKGTVKKFQPQRKI